MINPVLTASGACFVLAVAVISTDAKAPTGQPCVPVKFTLRSYTGPIVIDNACLDTNSYNGTLRIDAADFGDSIFRNGFDPEGP